LINTETKNTHPLFSTKKITISGLVIALYVCVMFFTQSFAFGQYQIRVATSLYALSAIYPFLIIPMGLANFLSNTIMGGLGPLDMFGGALVGILTASCVYLVKKMNFPLWLIALPIIIFPTLLVPIWLSYLIHVPYITLVISLGVGQILPGILGVLIVKSLGKILI
jgi:uncharacterized membrane protein